MGNKKNKDRATQKSQHLAMEEKRAGVRRSKYERLGKARGCRGQGLWKPKEKGFKQRGVVS